MPVPPKAPKPKITIGPIIKPADDVVTARQRMWAGWMQDCADIQDAFVEGLLANLQGKDG